MIADLEAGRLCQKRYQPENNGRAINRFRTSRSFFRRLCSFFEESFRQMRQPHTTFLPSVRIPGCRPTRQAAQAPNGDVAGMFVLSTLLVRVLCFLAALDASAHG
jgi:hypothetical protein